MNIGIIGAGNMASAFAGGLISSETIRPDELSMSDRTASKLVKWQEKGVFTTEDNCEIMKHSDIVIFAVKPNILPAVLEEAKKFAENRIFISIAAGVRIETIEGILGDSAKIIRAMPNTPAKVRCGMVVLSANKNVEDSELKTVEQIFSSIGCAIVMDEKHINTATALHGSSPAYVYMLIDAMADSGVKYGIPKNTALLLAAKAVEGAAKMVLETGEHPQKLKDDVCSPGGTTIEAVCELEKNGFSSDVQKAIDACIKKANEMA